MNEVLDQPTPEQKLTFVRSGRVPGWAYQFRAPPVPHAKWGDADWVRYVDAARGWRRVPPA